MPLVNETKVSLAASSPRISFLAFRPRIHFLAPCLSLSVVSAVCLSAGLSSGLCSGFSCALPVAAQPSVRKMTVKVPVKDSSRASSTSNTSSTSSTSSATSTNDEFEARMRAQAMAAEVRQNEAVQHYDASRVYLSSGNTEMAELELQAAIMNGPNIRAFHRDYCLVSILRGHPMRAVAEAMMVVGLGDPIPFSEKQIEKLKDRGCKLHYRRGLELAGKKNWKDAITEFQWALEYRPNNGTVMRSMAFANASLGNIELAERQYGTSFSHDPADAYGHADLAFLLAETGKGTEAIKQLQAAVKLQPKVAALHIDLGWMAESKGNLGEAEGEFAEAVKLSPKHASLWTHLGKLLARQGKSDEAADAYKTALGLDPSAEDAQHGLENLKNPAPETGGGAGVGSSSNAGVGSSSNAGAGSGSNAGAVPGATKEDLNELHDKSGAGVKKGQGSQEMRGGRSYQMPPMFFRKDS